MEFRFDFDLLLVVYKHLSLLWAIWTFPQERSSSYFLMDLIMCLPVTVAGTQMSQQHHKWQAALSKTKKSRHPSSRQRFGAPPGASPGVPNTVEIYNLSSIFGSISGSPTSWTCPENLQRKATSCQEASWSDVRSTWTGSSSSTPSSLWYLRVW